VSTVDPAVSTALSGGADPAGADRPRRRLGSSLRRAAAGRLAVAPLLVFVAVGFGVPAVAMAYGAFTTNVSGAPSSYTMGNVTASLQGGYLTALLGSVKLSATSALIGTVVGLLLAQAVVTSRFQALRHAVLSASGVLANFGGVPLAFAFIATLGNAGVLTTHLHLLSTGWSLYNFWGHNLVYFYFLIPLMVLSVLPSLDGLRRQWREAAQNNGATLVQYWRHVALPVLAPSLLGGFVLLFGTAFAAYATAAAMVGASVPLITLQIANALNGNVDPSAGNIALAMSLDMVVIAVLVMLVYLPLQRRSARWLV
jgi:putative spermidine/putrescine transport system permease protein